MTSPQYSYSSIPLDPNHQEIRVLELQPGPEASDLIGQLDRCSVNNPQLYEALSYTWGPSHKSEKIHIGSNEVLVITDNLASALRVLRSNDNIRRIWIDAICINQNDIISKYN
jgi:hypothetical protein